MSRRQLGPLNMEEHQRCQERRARVLQYPDIARKLTQPPLRFSRPDQWNGYIPPAAIDGKFNHSATRQALIEICYLVVERERAQDGQALQEAIDGPPPDPAEQDPPVAPALVKEPQLTYLHTLMSQAGLTEKADKLDFYEEVLGTRFKSSKDLTTYEASRVITELRQLLPEEREPPHDDHEQAQSSHDETTTQAPLPAQGSVAAERDEPSCPWCTPDEPFCPVCRPDPEAEEIPY